jgi:hypothetical protein
MMLRQCLMAAALALAPTAAFAGGWAAGGANLTGSIGPFSVSGAGLGSAAEGIAGFSGEGNIQAWVQSAGHAFAGVGGIRAVTGTGQMARGGCWGGCDSITGLADDQALAVGGGGN